MKKKDKIFAVRMIDSTFDEPDITYIKGESNAARFVYQIILDELNNSGLTEVLNFDTLKHIEEQR